MLSGKIPSRAALRTCLVVSPLSFQSPRSEATYSTKTWSSSGTRTSIELAMLILSTFMSTLSVIMNRISRNTSSFTTSVALHFSAYSRICRKGSIVTAPLNSSLNKASDCLLLEKYCHLKCAPSLSCDEPSMKRLSILIAPFFWDWSGRADAMPAPSFLRGAGITEYMRLSRLALNLSYPAKLSSPPSPLRQTVTCLRASLQTR